MIKFFLQFIALLCTKFNSALLFTAIWTKVQKHLVSKHKTNKVLFLQQYSLYIIAVKIFLNLNMNVIKLNIKLKLFATAIAKTSKTSSYPLRYEIC